MQVWHHRQSLLKSPHRAERCHASLIQTRFLKVKDEIIEKSRLDLYQLFKLTPLKLSTVKKYLARLQELKREAFS